MPAPAFCTACGTPWGASTTACSVCGAPPPRLAPAPAPAAAPAPTLALKPIDPAAAARDLAGADLLRVPAAATVALDAVPEPSGPVPRRRPAAATMEVAAAHNVEDAGGHATILDAQPPPPSRIAPARRGIPDAVTRALPLGLLAAIGAGALTYSIVDTLRDAEAQAHQDPPDVSTELRTVDLPPVVAVVGLSDDNKEAVLSACWRISANPTHECQPSYLTELGEFPAREVPIGPLRADVFEVSNAAWQRCVDAGACPLRDLDPCRFYTIHRFELGVDVPTALLASNKPATCVTHAEAQQFCAWRDMRLPTGEEWERVARSGADRMYPWGSFWLPALLNWGERDMIGFPIAGRLDGEELTAPVDAYPDGHTDDGVYNVLGNVAEWTARGPEDSEGSASARGGSYADDVTELRITTRWSLPVTERRTTVGFRCVADLPPSAFPAASRPEGSGSGAGSGAP